MNKGKSKFESIIAGSAVAFGAFSAEARAQTQELPRENLVDASSVMVRQAENPMSRQKLPEQSFSESTIEKLRRVIMFGPAGTEDVVKRIPEEVSNRLMRSAERTEEPKQGFPIKVPYVGVESLLVPGYKELALEGAWFTKLHEAGVLKGFSFVEVRPGSVFTNNNVAYKHAKSPAFPTMEAGVSNGRPFMAAGVGLNLKETFPLGLVFDSATVTYLHRVFGVSPEHQVVFVWDTVELKKWGLLEVDSQGFMRFRPGSVGKYGQPQLLFGSKKLPSWMKVLVQFDVAGTSTGTKVGVSTGVKVYPQKKWFRELGQKFKGTTN